MIVRVQGCKALAGFWGGAPKGDKTSCNRSRRPPKRRDTTFDGTQRTEDLLPLRDSWPMAKINRLGELLFLLVACALLAFFTRGRAETLASPSPSPAQPSPIVAPTSPQPRPVTPSPTARPKPPVDPTAPLGRDLKLTLELLQKDQDPHKVRLRVSVYNPGRCEVRIPGSFCQEGDEADWWSHAVRVKVSDGSRSWRLCPSYGLRELHTHPAYPMNIGPGERRTWGFALDGLSLEQGENWEQALSARQLNVSCELAEKGACIRSNSLNLLRGL